jgi:hypothetical protein
MTLHRHLTVAVGAGQRAQAMGTCGLALLAAIVGLRRRPRNASHGCERGGLLCALRELLEDVDEGRGDVLLRFEA